MFKQLSILVVIAMLTSAACTSNGRTPIPTDSGAGDTSTTDTGADDSAMDGAMDDAAADSGTPDSGGDDSSTPTDGAMVDGAMDGALADGAMDGATGDAMVDGATGDAATDAAADTATDASSTVCTAFDLGMATGAAVASGDLTGAGDDGQGSCGSSLGEDRAYTWTPPSTGMWTFDTFGSDADTVLHAHLGAECVADEIDCNDDTFGFQSRLDLDLVAGTPVTLVVDSYDASSAGAFTLRITATSSITADETGACDDGIDNDLDGTVDCADVECELVPSCFEVGANCSDTIDNDGDGAFNCDDSDCNGYAACVESVCTGGGDEDGDGDVDCADADCLTDAACETCPAVSITGVGTTTGTTTGETNNRIAFCGGGTSPDRTHLFTAPATGTYTIDTVGSAYDTVLYVLDGDCDGLEIACNDDLSGSVSQSSVILDLAAGQSVVIVVDGYFGGNGDYNLNIASAAMTFSAPATAGDLVITELIQNPSGTDAGREWFEVVNTTASTLNLNGCIFSDLSVDDFTVTGDLLIRPGEYAVFAESGTPGGFRPSYDFTNQMILSNADDEVILTCAGTEIDRVEYDGGPAFVTPNGATMSLSGSMTDHIENDRGANWCSSPLYITPYDGENRGTPGSMNPDC